MTGEHQSDDQPHDAINRIRVTIERVHAPRLPKRRAPVKRASGLARFLAAFKARNPSL